MQHAACKLVTQVTERRDGHSTDVGMMMCRYRPGGFGDRPGGQQGGGGQNTGGPKP